MQDTAHIKGLSELDALLQTLAPKLELNVLRGALRAGMNIVKLVAQQNIHSVSGELAKGLKVGTRLRGGTVRATLKATGKHRTVAHLVEFGTKAHTITAKGMKALSFHGLFFQSVHHPGAQPHPFMRPALDQEGPHAVIAVGNYIKSRLETKYGLDTAHIMVDGDEP